jgi:cysteine desulfurase
VAEPAVYLDHHATTPCDPRVVEAMLPCFADGFGNPASPHAFGRAAREQVEAARGEVAELLGCEPAEIVFTSGATEADNLAIKGVAAAYAHRGRHLVTTAIEHPAVLESCGRLERQGYEVTYLGVEADGRLRPETVARALSDNTVLVSVMLANHEIGTLQPLAEISRVCRERGVLLHTDAAQALAYFDCDVRRLGVDLMSISGHKAYGPKGVGALYLRRRGPRVRLKTQMDGGGHEGGRRSGTANVPGIVGLGRACALVAQEQEADAYRLAGLRDRLLAHLREALPELRVHGSLEHRLPNNLHVSVPGLASDALVSAVGTVAVSAGAACSSVHGGGSPGSHVLQALPGGADAAGSALRMGLGRFTTAAQVDRAAGDLVAAIRDQLRRGVPTAPATCAPCG